ncbi:MAG: GTPase, partial [Flavobacterium sp.]
AIEAGLYKNNNYWTLIDTAGLRTTDNIIEQMGITRSYQEAQKSDIVLLVFDGSHSLTDDEKTVYQTLLNNYKNKIIIINNKSDLPQQSNQLLNNHTIISTTHHNSNNNAVESAIQEKINLLFESIESPFLLNQRHYNGLLSLEQQLQPLNTMLTANPSYELISYHLNDAIATLSELTGKTISEAGMDAVFREFCVGK